MHPESSTTTPAAPDAMYRLLRNILFRLDPERAHAVALGLASVTPARTLLRWRYGTRGSSCHCLGMEFPNPVGMAAGLDKNGDYIDALAAMGFGFIEIGTVTPKPQDGNPLPRMFRLPRYRALINRMGFNNHGVDYLVARAAARSFKGPLGINIGKNASTALEDAPKDYLHCLERVYPVADYVSVNVSSPNTQGLRDLQHGEQLRALLEQLKNAQHRLADQHGSYKPLLVKIAPDMSDDELHAFCDAVLEFEIDGVISGNTSNQREMVADSPHAAETGGLSGAPIRSLADRKLAIVGTRLAGKTAVIGVGGISSGQHAFDKKQLGADLVQLYTGLIYQGPALVRDCIRKLA